MKDIFEDMRDALGLEYISDIPFYRNKEHMKTILNSLSKKNYPEKEIEEFEIYAFQKR